MDKPVLIVAANMRVADHYARGLGLLRSEYVYATTHTVRGMAEPLVFYVGNYVFNKEIEEIERALEPARPRRFRVTEMR